MANNHAVVLTSKCACMDVDALNACGIYKTSALDNGVMVELVKMTQDGKKNIEGFEWEVKPAQEKSTGVWVIDTPTVGSTIEMQMHDDPRYFYNEAGRPMSIKKLVPGVDYIEVTKEAFTDATLPTGTPNTVAKIGAGGKLTGAVSAPAQGDYFEFVGIHYIAIGMEKVPTAILRYTAGKAQV